MAFCFSYIFDKWTYDRATYDNKCHNQMLWLEWNERTAHFSIHMHFWHNLDSILLVKGSLEEYLISIHWKFNFLIVSAWPHILMYLSKCVVDFLEAFEFEDEIIQRNDTITMCPTHVCLTPYMIWICYRFTDDKNQSLCGRASPSDRKREEGNEILQ